MILKLFALGLQRFGCAWKLLIDFCFAPHDERKAFWPEDMLMLVRVVGNNYSNHLQQAARQMCRGNNKASNSFAKEQVAPEALSSLL